MPLQIADKDKQITRTYSLTQELPNAISSTWTTVTPTAKIDEISTYQYATSVRSGSFASHEESVYINQTVSTDVFRAVTSIISSYESTKTVTDISYNTSDNAKFTSYNKTVTYTAFDREETIIESTGDNYNDSVRGIAIYDTESMSFGHTTFPAASASSKYSNGSTLLTVSVTSDFNCVLMSKTGLQNQIIFTNDSYDADPIYTYASDFPYSNSNITIDKDGDYFYITRDAYKVVASIYSGLSFNPYGTHTSQTNFVGKITAGLTQTTAAALVAEPIPEMYRTSAAFFNLYNGPYPAFGIAYRQSCSSSMNASISSLVNDIYNAESTAFVSYVEQSVTGHASVQMTNVDFMYTNYIYGDSKSTWEDYLYRDSIMSNYSSALSNNQEYFYLHNTSSGGGYKYDDVLRNALPAKISIWSGESATSSITRVTGISQSSSEDTTAYAGSSSFITTTATSASLSVSGTGTVRQDVSAKYSNTRSSTYGTAGSSTSASTSGYTGKTSISKSSTTATYVNATASYSCTKTYTYTRDCISTYTSTYSSRYTSYSSNSGSNTTEYAGISSTTGTKTISKVLCGRTYVNETTWTSSSSTSTSAYSNSTLCLLSTTTYKTSASSMDMSTISSYSYSQNTSRTTVNWTDSYNQSYCRQTSNGTYCTMTFGAGHLGALTNGYSTFWDRAIFTTAFPNLSNAWNTANVNLLYQQISNVTTSIEAILLNNGELGQYSVGSFTKYTSSSNGGTTSITGRQGFILTSTGTTSNTIRRKLNSTYDKTYSVYVQNLGSVARCWVAGTNSDMYYAENLRYYRDNTYSRAFNYDVHSMTIYEEAYMYNSYIGTDYFISKSITYPTELDDMMNVRGTFNGATVSASIRHSICSGALTLNKTSFSSENAYGTASFYSTSTLESRSTREGNTTYNANKKEYGTLTTSSNWTKSWANLDSSYTYAGSQYYNITTNQSTMTKVTTQLSTTSGATTAVTATTTQIYSSSNSFTRSYNYVYSTKSVSDTALSSSTNTNGACTIPNFSSTTALTRSNTFTTTTNGIITNSAWTSTAYLTQSSTYSTTSWLSTTSSFSGEGTYTMQSDFLTGSYNTNLAYYPISSSSSSIQWDNWYSTFTGSSSETVWQQKAYQSGSASVEGEYVYYTETYPRWTSSTATFDTVTKSLTSSKFETFTVESNTTFPDVEFVTDQVSSTHYYATTTNVGTTTSLTETYDFSYLPEYSIADNVTVTLTDVATHNTLI